MKGLILSRQVKWVLKWHATLDIWIRLSFLNISFLSTDRDSIEVRSAKRKFLLVLYRSSCQDSQQSIRIQNIGVSRNNVSIYRLITRGSQPLDQGAFLAYSSASFREDQKSGYAATTRCRGTNLFYRLGKSTI